MAFTQVCISLTSQKTRSNYSTDLLFDVTCTDHYNRGPHENIMTHKAPFAHAHRGEGGNRKVVNCPVRQPRYLQNSISGIF